MKAREGVRWTGGRGRAEGTAQGQPTDPPWAEAAPSGRRGRGARGHSSECRQDWEEGGFLVGHRDYPTAARGRGEAGPRTWTRPVPGVSAGGPWEEAGPALPGSVLPAPHSQLGIGWSLSGGRVTQRAVAGGGRARPARADRPVLSQPLHRRAPPVLLGAGGWWPRGRPGRVLWSALTAKVPKHATALRKH